MRFRVSSWIGLLALGALAALGCDDDEELVAAPTRFEVRVENVSVVGLLPTTRAMGTVPLSPGVYAVYREQNPLFLAGETADAGTELLAEDGFIDVELLDVAGAPGVVTFGSFETPATVIGSPAILAGESASFDFDAVPGDRLTFETMFVQSNDWFYSFDADGIPLFDEAGDPVIGDVTPAVVLWDAGTEVSTAPGTGEFQKPVQDAAARNVGPVEAVAIEPVAQRYPNLVVPPAEQVIRVTVRLAP